MANLARPPMRSSTERLVQTKLNFAPVAPDDADRSAPHNTTVSTRRSSKSGPLLVLGDDEKSVKQIAPSPTRPPRPPPPPRTASRKRPSAALDDAPDASEARPPTKVLVQQPHGELVRITNGVQTLLGIDADDVPSGRSTPRPGSAGKLAVPAPAADPKSRDRRSLRSSDGGSRLKSDLAVYFSSYDDVIAGLPKPSEYLDIDTPIYIVDEPSKSKTPAPASPEPLRKSATPTRTRKQRAPTPSRDTLNPSIPPAQSSTTFQVLDYTTVARHIPSHGDEDPLADAHFFAQHRRAERKEKQLRNIEKERAMHEKQQLERLLDGLQGPDWLRVMGITGVTAGETRDWEPKRDYFIKEVEALVDKFRVWKQEEKRIRAEKEAALAARTEDEDDDGEESEASEASKANGRAPHTKDQQPREPEPPKPKRPPRPHGFLLPFVPPEPTTPFVSFYSKPHLRAAAMGNHRHGRNATAFGQPIPDFEEHEFELPDDYIDPQFLRDNARQRRRRQRERQSGANTQPT